jgi:NADH-quinone oxidoreductase subunit N
MIEFSELGVVAPIWVTALSAALVLLLTVAGGFKRPAPTGGAHLSMVVLAGVCTSAWLLWRHTGTDLAFSGAIILDGLAATFGFVTLVGAAIVVLLAEPYLREHEMSRGEFLALVALSAAGMLILVMAGDLMTLFIGIETMSLGAYVLAGYRRSSRRSQEAALKYFIYGAFASAFVLFGIALLYGEVGRLSGTPSLGITALGQALAKGVSSLGWIGIALVLVGLAFKVAAVPFHMWAPDVYEGAPTPSAGFMAVGIKAAAFAGLLRFVAAAFLAAGPATETVVQVFEIIAVMTMVVGNFLAVRQTQIKRMLAYSSIAHAGYVLVGVAAYCARPDGGALSAINYYLLGYTAMTLGAFGVVLAFERRDDSRLDLAIDRLAGAAQRHPALGLAMAVFMFSLAGVPPTAGFFGKLSLFASAVEAGRVAVVIIAVLTSAVGAFYYLRVLVVMYMRGSDGEERRIASPYLAAGLWACVAITLIAGLLPESYIGWVRGVLGS